MPHGSQTSLGETNAPPGGLPERFSKFRGDTMHGKRRGPVLIGAGILNILMGLALAVGGVWLIALGGSWYYAIAAVALLLTGVLLLRARPAALLVYALLVAGTLAWSLWEVGFDWWPLAARGAVIFVVGLILLTPWVTRRLGDGRGEGRGGDRRASALRGSGLALTAVLVVGFGVAAVSWFTDPHRIEGTVPAPATAAADTDPASIPAGEWHAYGRTGHAQRYSPLDQITPANVSNLETAWTYQTGDMRGQPGDPEETTFEVTPLKIGNRLFLCTPHQNVIALDATTGREIWRYDPKIRGELALQHLTCRGLSYHQVTAEDAAVAADTPANTPATGETVDQAAPGTTAAPGGSTELDLPVAASSGAATTADCPAMLFMPTADGRIIALNPDSGAVCTGFGGGTGQINLWTNMPNVNPGSYYSTSPVVVARGLIIVGGTVLDNVSVNETSGVIRAFDIKTGALVWNWDSDNPDATAPIGPGESYTPNSPNSWSISAVDENLGMVYVPLGNQPPDQWGGNRSPAVEKYSSSVVALDIATGQVRWNFQTVHHDLWDYDVPAQPSLIDLTVNGRTVPALVQPTKQGELFVLDRRTGEPVLPVTEKPAPQGAAEGDHTAPTQPVSALSFDPPPLTGKDMWGATMFDQLACRVSLKRLRYEGRYTPPSLQGSLVYPGNFGVFNWGSVAVDPQRQIAFTTPTYLAFVSQLIPRADDTTTYVQGENAPEYGLPSLNENFGAPFAVKLAPFVSALGLPCQAPPWGYVAAADLTTGKLFWKHKNGTVRDASPLPLPFRMGVPNLGGPITTAGGVAFLSGTIDYYVRGYDVTTGEQLWESRLPAGGQATPMTYLGDDGRQYLLVVAGGHGSLGTKAGDSVIAYALPRQ
jgi:quinoprotein glucose dehydrogenase